jgi:peptidoglycan/xylan/chitin deacetylase (PgdA/CDA1 family)
MHPIWYLVSGLTVSQVYTRVMTRSNSIYLTFDDGPDAEHTPRVLDLLALHGAKATFFLRGDNAERNAELARRLVKSGHALGNHSYSHPSFGQLAWRRQVEEIERTDRLLESFDGRKKHAFRPPYGKLTLQTLALCLWRRQRVALWTHDSLDFRLDTQAIVQRLQELRVRGGDIVLFHDDGVPGIAALEQVLPVWRAAGFEFPPL